VCVVLCAVFRLIVVLFCVKCVICLLCLIVNHCHRVKTHLQLINITLHYNNNNNNNNNNINKDGSFHSHSFENLEFRYRINGMLVHLAMRSTG
jgi:hypothetical protein